MIGRKLLLPLLLILSTACTALYAVEGHLEVMANIWPRVAASTQHDPQLNADISAIISQMEAAIAKRSVPKLSIVDWPAIEASAIRGINQRVAIGELTAGTSEFLINRVNKFNEAWRAATNKP